MPRRSSTPRTSKDPQGTHHHAQYRYRQDELDRLRRGMAGFADRVWKFTDGNLRIDWNLQIIERPLTKLDGDSSFWPGPDACMPYLSDLKPGQADTIMGFYEHLMRDHVTRKMWRELSLTRPADNLFLMKVANGDGGWAAILRLTDPKGAPLPRVTYLTP